MDVLERFERDLIAFPSLRTIKNVKKTTSAINNLIRKLKVELDNAASDTTEMEQISAHNLISFLYNLIGDHDNTIKHMETAFSIDKSNIITLTGKAYFHLDKEENLSEINDIIETLKTLSTDKHRVIQAQAEVAVAFSRMGIHMYQTSASHFENVIVDALQLPEKCQPIGWKTNICIWRFRLALIKRRLLNMSNLNAKHSIDLSGDRKREVFDHLRHVIHSEDNNFKKAIQIYKAKAFAELGDLVFSVEKNQSLFPNGMRDIVPVWDSSTSSHTYIEKALELNTNDAHVFLMCGKYYRYKNKIDMSIDLLKKAVKIKDNSASHHHLALSLKRKMEIKNAPCQFGYGESTGHVRQLSFQDNQQLPQTKQKHQPIPANEPSGSETGSIGDSGIESTFSLVSENKQPLHVEGMEKLTIDPQKYIGRSLSEGSKSKPTNMYTYVNLVKSPRKVIAIDKQSNLEAINEILFHLDKAVELNNNTAAMYDKGCLFRQIGEPKEAFAIFKNIITEKGDGLSLMYLANSYEQAAYCILDRQPDNEDTNKQEDLKYYLKRSVEISCNIVAKLPQLANCWSAAPTLLTLLKCEATTNQTLKDLACLYANMKNWEKAIEVYEELLKVIEKEGERIEVITNLVKSYVGKGDYGGAILMFGLIMCIPDGHQKVDARLYIKIHVEGGFLALKNGEQAIAGIRFKNALQFHGLAKTQEGLTDDDADGFDVFVLCNEEDERDSEQSRNLLSCLKCIGLSATINTVDALPWKTVTEGIAEVMASSMHFIVVNPSKEFMSDISMIVNILKERKHGIAIVLSSSEVPSCISGWTVIQDDVRFCGDISPHSVDANDEVVGKLKEMLVHLSSK